MSYLLSRYVASARDLVVNADVNAQLFPNDVGEGASIPHVHPVSNPTAFLEVHAFLCDDPIEALRSGYRGAEPDLLVWGLLVEDERVLLGRDFEDAVLAHVSKRRHVCSKRRMHYAIVDFNSWVLFLCLL